MRFRDLDRETSDAARPAVNEHRLTRAQLRGVNQRLPRRQRDDWHRRSLHVSEQLRFLRRFTFRRHRILGITAAIL